MVTKTIRRAYPQAGPHRANVPPETDREKRYRAIFDHSAYFMGLLTAEGLLLEANQPALDFGGVALADIVNRPLWEACWWVGDPDAQAHLRQAVAQAAEGQSVGFELDVHGSDGRNAMIDFTLRPARDEHGEIAWLVAEGREITVQRSTEADLRQSREMLQLVLDTIPQGVVWKDRDSRYLGCNRVVAKAMGLDNPWDIIGMRDAELPSLKPEEAELFVRKDREVMESGEARLHIIEPMTLPGGETIWLDTNKIPLYDSEKQVIGVLGTWEDITERKKVEAALSQSEARYARAIRGTSDGVWDWDIPTDELYLSPRWKELLGFTPQELPNRVETFFSCLHPDDVPNVRAAIEAHLHHHAPYDVDFRMKSKAGDYRWFRSRGEAERDASGKAVRMAGAVTDITDKRLNRERLRASEELFRTFMDNSPAAAWIANADGRVDYVSQTYARMFRVPANPVGRHWSEVFSQALMGSYRQDMEAVLQTGQVLTRVHAGTRADGEPGQFLVYIFPLPGGNGHRSIGGVAMDVTAQWRAELALREAHQHLEQRVSERTRELSSATQSLRVVSERLQMATRAANIGIWDWDIKNSTSVWDDGMFRLYGLSRETSAGGYDAWVKAIHPEDRKHAMDSIEQALHGEKEFNTEFRLVWPDQSVHFVKASALVQRDATGKPIRMVGMDWDITDRRRAEAERDRFFTISLDMMCIASADGYFRMISPAVTALLGWTVEEMLATPYFDLIHPDDREATQREVEKQMKYGEPVLQFENRYRHKDGSWHVLSWRSVPQPDGLMYAIARDVTRRKAAEEELRDAHANLERSNAELRAFSYSVSHDLRAPLRGIDGWSQALLEDCGPQLDDHGREYLDRVRSETQRMGRLIDDLLALSRTTQAEMIPRDVDMSAVANAIVARLREDDRERQVDVTIEPGLHVMADSGLLRAALTNLLENAWKFTSKNPEAKIVFGRMEKDGKPTYFIRDNGAGFDMRYAEKLFAPFQRMHRVSEYPGTGIGLATVQRIIHRHGGTISAEAKPGEGAAFYFTLERPQ